MVFLRDRRAIQTFTVNKPRPWRGEGGREYKIRCHAPVFVESIVFHTHNCCKLRFFCKLKSVERSLLISTSSSVFGKLINIAALFLS